MGVMEIPRPRSQFHQSRWWPASSPSVRESEIEATNFSCSTARPSAAPSPAAYMPLPSLLKLVEVYEKFIGNPIIWGQYVLTRAKVEEIVGTWNLGSMRVDHFVKVENLTVKLVNWEFGTSGVYDGKTMALGGWSYPISKFKQKIGLFLVHWRKVSKITRPLLLSSPIQVRSLLYVCTVWCSCVER
jgi:hypothetical protein